MAQTILVIGATGHQGGATVNALLERGFSVRGLTHSPDSEKARALAQRGVEMVAGNLDDPPSLERAMRGADGAFSVINFREGVDKEEARGKRAADAAKVAGIGHFIYSSVGGAERDSGVPHFESKWHIEQHIRSLGIPYSIVRPTAFMMNLMEAPPLLRFIALSMLRGASARSPVQMIAVRDIGQCVAEMFAKRDEYLGRAVEIAGDAVDFEGMIEAYQTVYHKTPWSLPVPLALMAKGDLGKMIVWIAKGGYHADLNASRRAVSDLLTFQQFVAQRRLFF
jgi:uncharacterized protein YbjT (DUF2867 family)